MLRPPRRGRQLARCLQIVMRLSNTARLPMGELVSEFSCDAGWRTIYRDIELLREAGIPIIHEDGEVWLLSTAVRGAWFITPHAVRRYIERIAPHLSYGQALAELISESERAHFVRADETCEQWRGAKPRRLRFRVARGEAGLPQLVTVLPSHDKGRRASA